MTDCRYNRGDSIEPERKLALTYLSLLMCSFAYILLIVECRTVARDQYSLEKEAMSQSLLPCLRVIFITDIPGGNPTCHFCLNPLP